MLSIYEDILLVWFLLCVAHAVESYREYQGSWTTIMSYRCDTSLCTLIIANISSIHICICACLAAGVYTCVLFSEWPGFAQPRTGLRLLCTSLCVSSQEDMVFVPKHFNVYLETMAWNKRREAERERDNEVSQLRESAPCTIELTWIIWKAPLVNSFAVLARVWAAGAFTWLWWSVYSVFVLMWRMSFAL